MEVSGAVSRRLPCFSAVGIDAHSHSSSLHGVSINVGARFSGELRLVGCRNPKASVEPIKFSGFSDTGHLRYCYRSSSATGGGGGKTEKEKGSSVKAMAKKAKKKLKLLKGLSRDLSMFSEMGSGHDVGEVKGKVISEAAELLLEQLQQLRAEQKELKRKKKEEKAKLRAARMHNMESPSSSASASSEPSDSECGEVVDVSRLKNESLAQPIVNELVAQSTTASIPNPEVNKIWLQPQEANLAYTSTPSVEGSPASTSCSNGSSDRNSLVATASAKKIEVCMGGKCKKSGAPALLDEFQRVVGVEGAVVGCKCMGKCRNGPNVRVLTQANGVENFDDSVRMPRNPLFIGVGFEDVGLIVSNLFGETQNDLGLAAAAAS